MTMATSVASVGRDDTMRDAGLQAMTMDNGRDDNQPAKKKAVDNLMVAVGRAMADKIDRPWMNNDYKTSVLLLSSAATTMPPCSPLHCAAATAATVSEEEPVAAGLAQRPESGQQ
jgi:hypothetical protein